METNGKWFDVKAVLPTELADKAAWVRIKGKEDSGKFVSSEILDMVDLGLATLTTEFLFVSELYLVSGDPTGIESIEGDKAAAQGVVYDLMGRKVAKPVAGQLYIMNGKKFVVK